MQIELSELEIARLLWILEDQDSENIYATELYLTISKQYGKDHKQ